MTSTQRQADKLLTQACSSDMYITCLAVAEKNKRWSLHGRLRWDSLDWSVVPVTSVPFAAGHTWRGAPRLGEGRKYRPNAEAKGGDGSLIQQEVVCFTGWNLFDDDMVGFWFVLMTSQTFLLRFDL